MPGTVRLTMTKMACCNSREKEHKEHMAKGVWLMAETKKAELLSICLCYQLYVISSS